jgi:hypothetical protein
MNHPPSSDRGHGLRRGVLCALVAFASVAVGCARETVLARSTVRAFGAPRAERIEGRRPNSRVISGIAGAGATATPSDEPSARAATAPAPVRPERANATPETDGIEERTVPVSGTDVQAGMAIGEIDAPFERVAATLQDWGSLRLFLPRIGDSRAVRRRRAESDVYLRADLPDGFGSIWVLARFRVARASGSLVLDGARIDGTLRRFDLRIEANDIVGTGRTRVAVQLLGLPPFPLPSGYLTRQHGRWTGRALRALRDRVEALPRAASPAPGSSSAR